MGSTLHMKVVFAGVDHDGEILPLKQGVELPFDKNETLESLCKRARAQALKELNSLCPSCVSVKLLEVQLTVFGGICDAVL